MVLSAVLGLLIAAQLFVLVRGVGAPLAVAAALTLVGFDDMMPSMMLSAAFPHAVLSRSSCA